MSTTEFSSLVLQERTRLTPLAVRLTNDQELAKDLCQETLCRAYASREKFQAGTNMRAWLCTIMRNVFLNDTRKEKYRRIADTSLRCHAPAFAMGSESKVKEAEIHRAIYRLSPKLKRSFQLYLAGYHYEEIAYFTGQPVGSIKSNIHLARKQLQSILN